MLVNFWVVQGNYMDISKEPYLLRLDAGWIKLVLITYL